MKSEATLYLKGREQGYLDDHRRIVCHVFHMEAQEVSSFEMSCFGRIQDEP